MHLFLDGQTRKQTRHRRQLETADPRSLWTPPFHPNRCIMRRCGDKNNPPNIYPPSRSSLIRTTRVSPMRWDVIRCFQMSEPFSTRTTSSDTYLPSTYLWKLIEHIVCSNIMAHLNEYIGLEDIWFFQRKIEFYFTEWTSNAVFSRMAVATSENTSFRVHQWHYIRFYAEKKIKFSVSFMLLFTIIKLLPVWHNSRSTYSISIDV